MKTGDAGDVVLSTAPLTVTRQSLVLSVMANILECYMMPISSELVQTYNIALAKAYIKWPTKCDENHCVSMSL